MKIGRLEINFRKSYKDLDRFIAMEKRTAIGDPKTNPYRQLAEYKSWVSSATSLISRSVSTTPYKFYRKDTDEEITSRIHGYTDFTKAFLKPNKYMTFRFIKAWIELQADLCGMGVGYKARNAFGETREIWPLNMNDFMGAYDVNGRPIETVPDLLPTEVFYVFNVNGRMFSFRRDELIMIIHPHPKYLYIGASPIQQQAYVVDIQNYIEIYERDFFANSARVDMVLTTADELGQTKADEIKERWLSKFRGNYHDVAVLDKGLTPVPMKYTNQDFQFMELARWSRDMVLGAYGINAAKLGMSDDVNRSNSVFVDIAYNRDVVQPRLTMWDEECTQAILAEYNPNIEIRHDNPIPRDRQIETQEARVFLGGIPFYNINEYRKTKNLKADPNGDKILVPTKFIPLDMLEKYWNAQIKQLKNPPAPAGGNGNGNQTDPARHDGDKPKVNPDGSDDRDNNPTDGRSIEDYLRKHWYNVIKNRVSEKEESYIPLFKSLIDSTVKSYLNYFGHDIEVDDWLEGFVETIGLEFSKTINMEYKEGSDWKKHAFYQMDTNSRIAKICNTGIKSCINYSRFLILESHGEEKTWEVNSNVCGHRGKIKQFTTNGKFKVNDTEMRFPGEVLNFNCDCSLTIMPKLLEG